MEPLMSHLDGYCRIINQRPVPRLFGPYLDKLLDDIVGDRGEGIVVRRPYSFWTPHRSQHMLRHKPKQDAECVVIGYNAGLGKHLGRLGSLRVRSEHGVFDLSGFTDEERYVGGERMQKVYEVDAGKQVNDPGHPTFPIGTRITFRYNGLTNGGLPREARYWRKRPEE